MHVSSRTTTFIAAAVVGFLIFVVLASFPKARAVLSLPLVLHDSSARGDACYVLAGGGSIWERLDAASDLVHMGRVGRIMLMEDRGRSQYNFQANRSWTKSEWMKDHLVWRGIPAEKIGWVAQAEGRFGTLTEARAVAKTLSGGCEVACGGKLGATYAAVRVGIPKDFTGKSAGGSVCGNRIPGELRNV